MLISIVIPVYNGAGTIGPLVERLVEVLGGSGYAVENVIRTGDEEGKS